MVDHSWCGIEFPSGSGPSVGLDLPPGWWYIRPSMQASDIPAVIAQLTRGIPTEGLRTDDLAAELGRLTRVSAAAGVELLAGGAAVDPDAEQLVTASLTVMPHEVYLAIDHSGQEHGPTARLDLEAGPATRHLWLGITDTALMRGLSLSVEYVVATPEPPSWALCFQTPALDHRAELVEVFDRVAATVRVGRRAAVSVVSAFS
jgi:hypothetical protein